MSATRKIIHQENNLFHVSDNSVNDSTKRVGETHTDELVIALCGPIGSPLHNVADKISDKLNQEFDYECKTIQLSHLIKEYASKVSNSIDEASAFKRIESLIETGNSLRKQYSASILAELAIHKIRIERERYRTEQKHQNYEPRRICHIIDSIKNQEELDLLRLVYREMLYVVGVFIPLEQRVIKLGNDGLTETEIYNLIDRDSGEETKTGQTVRDTFPQSDFFLRMDSDTTAQIETRVERFLNLILGAKIITPTADESAMYAAFSAASKSACLSRQVGAALTDEYSEVISVGWNDVPKFGGGLYEHQLSDPAGEKDERCWNKSGGKCFNDEQKLFFSNELLEVLKDMIPNHQMENARSRINSSRKLKGLIEFSRSIHAEMHAILNAGKIAGARIAGGKLFVTTYPCHSCARHIIAAGIKEVYFIEPYRKSLAIQLHGDAITETESVSNKVRLLPYSGVAPSRYLAFFKLSSNNRKENGLLKTISTKNSKPKLEKSLQALPELEGIVVKSLADFGLINMETKSYE